MKISSLKEVLKTKGLKQLAEKSTDWLISHGYVYSPVFGWEKIEIIERFKLDINSKGIPMELKPEWVEAKAKGKDKYGNTITGEDKTEWVQHPTKKKYYPSDNYLHYQAYKKGRNERDMIEKNIPLQEPYAINL